LHIAIETLLGDCDSNFMPVALLPRCCAKFGLCTRTCAQEIEKRASYVPVRLSATKYFVSYRVPTTATTAAVICLHAGSGAFAASRNQRRIIMSREIIRVEPLSSYLERYKAPASVMTRHGNTLYVSGLPPFDPATGEIVKAPIERQTELVLEQLKLCMETAGSSLDNILKCTVYCTSVQMFPAVNGVYAKFFPKNPPARMFVNVPTHPGPFDIEIDCIALV
jgi:2-iminobutanoate/2-iminopropanoate deaminase